MIVTILVNLDVITLGIGVGTDLGGLYGCSDGSTNDKLEGLFLCDFMESTDGKMLGSNEGINMGGRVVIIQGDTCTQTGISFQEVLQANHPCCRK